MASSRRRPRALSPPAPRPRFGPRWAGHDAFEGGPADAVACRAGERVLRDRVTFVQAPGGVRRVHGLISVLAGRQALAPAVLLVGLLA